MADGNILSDFGIDLLEEEIDDVIFQTNEFLTDATFTGSQGPFWWIAYFCAFSHLQLFINQLFAKIHSVKQIPDGTKTGQKHRKIKSRTLQARHPLPWTSLFCAKVRFCPVKCKQNPANMLSINHFYRMGIFRKILQVLHAQYCVSHFKGLLKSVLCHLYTTALPPMRIVLEQCTTYLPLSTMRNVCSVSKLVKNATWHNDRTKRHIQCCTI